MSDQLILFQTDDGPISVIFPTQDLPVEEVARKDVPAGRPYLIVDRASIPDAWEFQAAWMADFSRPDGVGLGYDAWFAQWVDPAKVQEDADAENAAMDAHDLMYATARQENLQWDAMQAAKVVP